MYRIIVLVKQVPDTKNIVGEAMKADGTINRAALPTIFNPEDLHALEMALEVKDRFGGEVHAVSMGPNAAMEILRESLYRGADYAYLISDPRFAAADTLATSYTLAKSIQKIASYDLIFCGRQAIDGDTAQVGPQVAQNLGIPQITYAEKLMTINNEERSITLRRQIDGGYEIVKGKMPLLVTVLETAPVARPRDIARTVFLRKTPIPTWKIEDIGAEVSLCGLSGSPTNVYKINSVNFSVENRETKQLDLKVDNAAPLIAKILAFTHHERMNTHEE